MSGIKIADLTKAVNDLLKEYGDMCTEALQEQASVSIKKAPKILKKTSPIRTGSYAKSWKAETQLGRMSVHAVAYNKDHYRITHLLENGHANRNGGRTQPKPHIKPANDEVQEDFINGVLERLEGIK